MEWLPESKLKIATDAFAKATNTELQKEIKDLRHVKALVMKYNPDGDTDELDYYIDLRKKALK